MKINALSILFIFCSLQSMDSTKKTKQELQLSSALEKKIKEIIASKSPNKKPSILSKEFDFDKENKERPSTRLKTQSVEIPRKKPLSPLDRANRTKTKNQILGIETLLGEKD